MTAVRLVDALRRRLSARSYARYFSREIWEAHWSGSYRLDAPKEDGRYGALVGLIRRYARGGPILDVGCGDGLLEAHLGAAVPVLGVDYSEAAIAKAQARCLPNCTFQQADYRQLNPPQRFPVIVLNESLYYDDDVRGIMHHLSGLLAPGGVFVVSMFATDVTRRIWKTLHRTYPRIQGIELRDEDTGERWTIRVLGA